MLRGVLNSSLISSTVVFVGTVKDQSEPRVVNGTSQAGQTPGLGP